MPRLLLAILVLVAMASPTLAQQPRPGRAADPAPVDTFAFVSVKVSKLWDNPAAKPLRDWVATQKDGILESFVGVPFADIDRVTAYFDLPDAGLDKNPIVLVTTRQRYDEAQVLKALKVAKGDEPKRRPVGRTARLSEGPFSWVILVDERTLCFVSGDWFDQDGGGDALARLIARKPKGPLAAILADTQGHDIAASLDFGAFEPIMPLLEKEKNLAPFLVLLKAKSAVLTADVEKTAKGKLVMTFPDAATAKQGAKMLEEGMKLIGTELVRERDSGEVEPVEKFVFGRFVDVLKNAKVTVDGSNVVATSEVPFADDLAKLVAVLPKSLKEHVTETTMMSNLKHLGIAMHNYHDAHNALPSDIQAGRKALASSWRVQILPFIEQDNLYKVLDHSKPWDDPANLKWLEEFAMPKVFEHPGRPAPKGQTYFRVLTLPRNAKGTDRPLFKEGERGPSLTAVKDGSSNTFMIVEAREAVLWYKPDVLAYDGKLPLPQLGDKDADVFLVVMADGSVRKLKPSKLGEKTLRAFITMSGGEVIELPK